MEPLTSGQKAFNQRLLAEHCLTEERAKMIWDDLARCFEDGMGSEDFGESIKLCNEQLKYCGLEIIGIAMTDHQANGGFNDTDKNKKKRLSGKTAGRSASTAKSTVTTYYAMVNRDPDDVAKKCLKGRFLSAHEQSFVRMVFEHLAQNGSESRNELINLRNDLQAQAKRSSNGDDDSSDGGVQLVGSSINFTLTMAENAINDLIQEKWLTKARATRNEEDDQDDDEEQDDDQDDDDESDAPRTSSQSSRRRGRGTTRRKSVTKGQIVLAPRAYMELSYLLEEYGMDRDDIPQQIYYRLSRGD